MANIETLDDLDKWVDRCQIPMDEVKKIPEAVEHFPNFINPPEGDAVHHPDHYISNGIETISVIEAWTEGLNGFEGFCMGNVIKYVSRWHKKNGVEDLKKANEYLNMVIEHIEEGNNDA